MRPDGLRPRAGGGFSSASSCWAKDLQRQCRSNGYRC
jgi:hypothetical protein